MDNERDHQDNYPIEHHPVLMPRRGEFIAWSLALLVGATWLVLIVREQPVIRAVPFLAVILLLVAGSITLGNWMDRSSLIRIYRHGIYFTNGLRKVQLDWDDIREVQVFPSRWGKKVRVIGEGAHFEFRTLGEVKVQDEVKGRIGFPDGEQILRQVIQNSGLKIVKRAKGEYYYARD